jgi:flagellar hook-basal body complex protein FliE
MTMPIAPRGLPPIVSPLERGGGAGGIALPTGEGSFGDLLTRALGDVQDSQQNRDDTVAAFLRGEPVELHQVMAAAEEASLSLQMLVEVRNKLTDAYRSVMNLQV